MTSLSIVIHQRTGSLDISPQPSFPWPRHFWGIGFPAPRGCNFGLFMVCKSKKVTGLLAGPWLVPGLSTQLTKTSWVGAVRLQPQSCSPVSCLHPIFCMSTQPARRGLFSLFVMPHLLLQALPVSLLASKTHTMQ